jgi:Flp pilus assembly protein CpaB
MSPRQIGYLFTAIGLVLSAIVAVVVYTQAGEAERVRNSLPSQRVVVAATDIPPRTEIAAAMLTVQVVPDPLVQTGAATRVEEVAGKFTPDGFVRGEVINVGKLGPLSARTTPSYAIEKGKVMYVMPVSFTGTPLSIARVNALRSGDRVDLLYTTVDVPTGFQSQQREEVRANPLPYLQTRIMLQDLRIQEIGSYAANGTLLPATGDPSTSGAPPSIENASIIFVVTPQEALVLKWLKDAATFYKDSSVEMVLRSPADEEQADPTFVVNLNYMRQKYNLGPPPAQ